MNNLSSMNAGKFSAPQLSRDELDLRVSLLGRNKRLQQLHKELVLPGHVSEEEFWEARRSMLDQHRIQLKQGRGLSSAIFAAIRPSKDSSGNTIRITITKELIRDIFQIFPAVKRRYESKGAMSDDVFWTKVIQSLHFHRDQLETQYSVPNSKFSSIIVEDDEEGDSELQALKQKNISINPLVDLSASRQSDDEEIDEKKPMTTDRNNRSEGIPEANTIMHRLNRQGGRILKTSRRKTIQSEHMRESTVKYPSRNAELMEELLLEDLQDQSPKATFPGAFDNRKILGNYGYSPGSMTDESLLNSDIDSALQQFREYLVSWNHPAVLTTPSSTFLKLWSQIQLNTRWSKTEIIQKSYEESVPSDIRSEISTYHANVNELLRHFYSSISLKSAEKWAKMTRIQTALKILKERIISCQSKSHVGHVLIQVKSILSPIVFSIDKALAEYDAEEQKRLQKIPSK